MVNDRTPSRLQGEASGKAPTTAQTLSSEAVLDALKMILLDTSLRIAEEITSVPMHRISKLEDSAKLKRQVAQWPEDLTHYQKNGYVAECHCANAVDWAFGNLAQW